MSLPLLNSNFLFHDFSPKPKTERGCVCPSPPPPSNFTPTITISSDYYLSSFFSPFLPHSDQEPKRQRDPDTEPFLPPFLFLLRWPQNFPSSSQLWLNSLSMPIHFLLSILGGGDGGERGEGGAVFRLFVNFTLLPIVRRFVLEAREDWPHVGPSNYIL